MVHPLQVVDKEQQELLVHQDIQVLVDVLVHKEHQVLAAQVVLLEEMVLVVSQDQLVLQALLVHQDLPHPLVLLDPQVHLVHQDLQVISLKHILQAFLH
jgi:hypothetical protein